MTASTRAPAQTPSAGGSHTANDRVTTVSAFVIRIVAGLLWVDNLGWKIPPDFGSNDDSGLYHFTKLAVDHPIFAPYSWLVEHVILPNFAPFGWLVFLVEICLAVFLIFGFATRFWAVIAIAQTIAIFLSVGAAPNEWKWSYFLMAATHLAILGFAAGRVWGLDGLLRRRLGSRPAGMLQRLYLMAS